MLRETNAYKEFLSKNKKHLLEDTFRKLQSDIIKEVWGELPEDKRSFSGAMGFLVPKQNAVWNLLQEDGITVHYNSEFEDHYKEWEKTQGPKPSYPECMDWYHNKRKEFMELYMKEKDCWVNDSV